MKSIVTIHDEHISEVKNQLKTFRLADFLASVFLFTFVVTYFLIRYILDVEIGAPAYAPLIMPMVMLMLITIGVKVLIHHKKEQIKFLEKLMKKAIHNERKTVKKTK